MMSSIDFVFKILSIVNFQCSIKSIFYPSLSKTIFVNLYTCSCKTKDLLWFCLKHGFGDIIISVIIRPNLQRFCRSHTHDSWHLWSSTAATDASWQTKCGELCYLSRTVIVNELARRISQMWDFWTLLQWWNINWLRNNCFASSTFNHRMQRQQNIES